MGAEVVPTSFSSIASAIGLGTTAGAALVAAMNGSIEPGSDYQGAEAYVPSGVGGASALVLPVPPPPQNGEPSQASQSWNFTSGGILVLDASDPSFTPLTFAGADDPQNAVYVMNASGQLIDVLTQSQGATVTITVIDTPANGDVPASTETTFYVDPYGNYNFGQSGEYSVDTDPNSGLPQSFTPAQTNYGLPFFDASSASTSAGAVLETDIVVDGDSFYDPYAAFNSLSDTPDQNWTIGVNRSGDAPDVLRR